MKYMWPCENQCVRGYGGVEVCVCICECVCICPCAQVCLGLYLRVCICVFSSNSGLGELERVWKPLQSTPTPDPNNKPTLHVHSTLELTLSHSSIVPWDAPLQQQPWEDGSIPFDRGGN